MEYTARCLHRLVPSEDDVSSMRPATSPLPFPSYHLLSSEPCIIEPFSVVEALSFHEVDLGLCLLFSSNLIISRLFDGGGLRLYLSDFIVQVSLGQ